MALTGKGCTYASTTGSTTATATAAAASRLAALRSGLGALGVLGSRLRLAGKLDRDLAVEDGLAVQLLNSAVGLRGGGDVNEGVANGAVGAGVLGDGDGLAGSRC